MNMMIDEEVVLELESLNDVLTCISIGVNEVNIKNEILSNALFYISERQSDLIKQVMQQ